MTTENTYWKRILTVYDRSGTSSISELAHLLGLRRAENLYQIKKGNNRISKRLAEKIHSVFPEFSISWLCFGDESIKLRDIQRDAARHIKYIPYFSSFDNIMTEPEMYIGFTQDFVPDATFAVYCSSAEMAPTLPEGSVLFLQQTHDHTVPGNTYLLKTSDGFFLRIVGSAPKKDKILLRPANPTMRDISIERDKILKIFCLKGHFSTGNKCPEK